jgi:hypothetical protein
VFHLDNRDILFSLYPRCTMIRWWKRDGTIVRGWKHDDTMMKTRWYDGEIVMAWYNIAFSPPYHLGIALSPSNHRVFTIVPSCFHDRLIAPLRFHHRTIVHRGYSLNKNHDCPYGTPYLSLRNNIVKSVTKSLCYILFLPKILFWLKHALMLVSLLNQLLVVTSKRYASE